MNRNEAEKYLYCAMFVGEQLLVSGAEVDRVDQLNQLSREICQLQLLSVCC